ncbi:T9SS type A sorting domain-containing protein [Winogradskyella sp.]|uniref:T9SS type A sorting domain-containing protein n=1 Tax=Winogradskyella sp. TaxID=1883156 RepID=UPI00261AAF21|nr:T9SS type A sorting domain-containing protein [Winogradskyella sp.]
MHRIKILISFLIYYQSGIGQNLSANSTGSFTFTPQPPLNRPPVEVFYHIPEGNIATMPILMSFHGAARDGATHRDYWVNMANSNGFMVFAPQFSNANYPGLGDNYIMSNIFEDGDNPSPETFNDQNEWTCSILDPLFEYIKTDISGTQLSYSAWGHSAGAQFLHRLFMYLPNSNINVAVCSNAGWYTVPEESVNYPYGILNSQLPQSDLISSFSNNIIIHLGQDDTVPSTDPGGPRDNTVLNNQQGLHRLERGQYFFNTSQTVAGNLGVDFNWEKHEVPNVGHDGQLMANDALQYLMPFLLSTPEFDSNTLSIFPNPTNTGVVTITSNKSDVMNVQVFDILGKQVKNETLTNNTLSVSDLKSGIYIVKITQNNASTTKRLVIR